MVRKKTTCVLRADHLSAERGDADVLILGRRTEETRKTDDGSAAGPQVSAAGMDVIPTVRRTSTTGGDVRWRRRTLRSSADDRRRRGGPTRPPVNRHPARRRALPVLLLLL